MTQCPVSRPRSSTADASSSQRPWRHRKRGSAPAAGTRRRQVSATTTAAEVGSFLGSQAGGGFGALLGGLAGGSLPGGATPVPVKVNAVIASKDGNAEVRSASGSVAGIPADPLVQIVVAAVAARL